MILTYQNNDLSDSNRVGHHTVGRILAAVGLTLVLGAPAFAQSTTAVAGAVRDEQDAAIPGVSVSLRQSSSGLERQTTTDVTGRYEIANLPVGVHDLTFSLPGFAVAQRRVHAATSARVELDIQLDLAAMTDAIQVVPQTTVVDSSSAGTRHSVAITRVERMPVAVTSRGLEAVLVAFPGFAQNANGAIHPRGAHNQMTFVVDGLPISDQLTGAFANALDVGVVQTAELVIGNIPAEFGSKVSGVAVLNSRSGLGTGRAFTGAVSIAGGGFGTGQGSVQVGGRARPRRLLRLRHDAAHQSLSRPGHARQPAQRRARDARLRPARRAPRQSDPAPHARHGRQLALRARQPALPAGRGPGPAPGAERRVSVELARADARCRVDPGGHRRLPDDDRRTAAQRRRYARHRGPGPSAVHLHGERALRPQPRRPLHSCRRRHAALPGS